jgi:methionyl-tRNA formyltransferase
VTAPHRLLVLTMPGFGVATVQHLATLPAWRGLDVCVALVGARPPRWRRLAAKLRRLSQMESDSVHWMAVGALSAGPAERWLRDSGALWQWAADDSEVHALRLRLQPQLTLTITSRVLFSPRTLAEPAGLWFNVHPGLLPDYAGASPAPYMYLDGVGGCTIHEMVERIDAGAMIDLAPMAEDLGPEVGTYFFQRLPAHTARRVAALIERWRVEAPIPRLSATGRALRHCSSSRLAADRRLDWRWPARRLERWVRALAAIAPAWWVGPSGHRVEVMEAQVVPGAVSAASGSVLRCQGRWIEVSCIDGAVALRCRSTPRVIAGQQLPSIPPAEV